MSVVVLMGAMALSIALGGGAALAILRMLVRALFTRAESSSAQGIKLPAGA